MEFRILGPLEVVGNDGSLVPIGGKRERALLALFLMSPNRVRSSDSLATDLRVEDDPEPSTHALQVYVSRLRKALREAASEDEVITQANGYLLHVEPTAIDAVRFEMLMTQSRELAALHQPARRAEVLREALALWRGAGPLRRR